MLGEKDKKNGIKRLCVSKNKKRLEYDKKSRGKKIYRAWSVHSTGKKERARKATIGEKRKKAQATWGKKRCHR